MKLADFVVPEAILPDLRATTKEAAVREMVDALRVAGCVGEADAEDVVRAILCREGLGTTGFGRFGVAFPEARHPAVGRLLGTIALSRGGVDFDAMGGGPVHILFLVVSPPARPGDFLRAEEMISWLLLGQDDFRDRLRGAGTREEIVGLIEGADRDALWEVGRARLQDRPVVMLDAPSGA
jgi:PTS system nitrogen regulatory IIA component